MTSIESYLSELSRPQKEALQRILRIVKEQVPQAEETFGYGMPLLKYQGKYLLGFAAFKDHMSIFPGSRPVEELKNELKDFKTSKGTIRFTAESPLSKDLLKKIVSICLEVANIAL